MREENREAERREEEEQLEGWGPRQGEEKVIVEIVNYAEVGKYWNVEMRRTDATEGKESREVDVN